MEEKDLLLLEESKPYIASMGKWMKFFAIMGCIGSFFLLLYAIFMLFFSSLFPMFWDEDFMLLRWISPIYIILAAVYIIPIIYMFRASAAAKSAVESNDNEQMVELLKNNKSLWKFYGIFSIVLMCSYFLIVIVFMIIAVVSEMAIM